MPGTDKTGAHCTRRQCALLVVFIAISVAAMCLLSVKFVTYIQTQRGSHLDGGRPLRQRLTAKPYSDFVDPNLLSMQRMFYNGRLLSTAQQADTPRMRSEDHVIHSQQRSGSPQTANVTVFRPGPEQLPADACVPLRASVNHNLTICLYDREVDQMISSYIRDNGVWEKEQVEGMLGVLAKDREERRQDGDLKGDSAPKAATKPRSAAVAVEDDGRREESKAPSAVKEDIENLAASRVRGALSLLRGQAKAETKHRSVAGVSSGENRTRLSVGGAMSVVDIGCNVGVYSLSAAGAGHPVLAVDPVTSNLQLLAASLRLNHLTSRVTLLHNAIAHRAGPLTLHLSPGNIGGSSVSVKKAHDSSRTVWGVCLNHLVPHVPTQRVFLKLDIEGWEERALRCAGEFFQQLDVQYVLMEWLFYRKFSGGQAIVDFLVRNGLLPYADFRRTAVLDPQHSYTWPDNVLWVKR